MSICIYENCMALRTTLKYTHIYRNQPEWVTIAVAEA